MKLPSTRKASWEFYSDLQSGAIAAGRWPEAEAWLGRNDLFYLLVRLLRRPDANQDWLFERAREVQASPNGHLDLWARGHYKSTWITFALTIQDILRDPEITVAIFSHTRPIAKGFLVQIKREFEDNLPLKALYSDVLWADPQKQAPRWSEDGGLIVKRRTNPRESTLEAWGLVDGMPTGRHYKLRIYDDIVADRMSPEMVQKTTDAWDLSQNLGVTNGAGIVRYIGTRYEMMDTYATMIDRGAVLPRVHAATSNGRMDGKPVFLTEEQWLQKLRDSSRAIIAAQQLQNPMADDDATFRTEWLQAYEVRPRTLNVYIMCDPSRGRTATSDNTAIAVIGVSSSGAKFLLDGACHRMALSERWEMLRTFYWRWAKTPGVQHVAVGYERFGAQSDDEYFQLAMREDAKSGRGGIFPIEELNWPREGGNSKRERIERLEPDFRNGRFFIPLPVLYGGKPCTWSVETNSDAKDFGDVRYTESRGLTRRQMDAIAGGAESLVARAIVQRDQSLPGARGGRYDFTVKLISDYAIFPFGRHDDLLDAVSRIYDMDPRAPLAPSSRNEIVNVYSDGI